MALRGRRASWVAARLRGRRAMFAGEECPGGVPRSLVAWLPGCEPAEPPGETTFSLPGKRHITPPRGAGQPSRVRGKQHRQPHEGSQRGKNLLSMAAAAGNIEAVDEVNRADEHGRTQLYIACQNGHVAVATLLLEKGAEVDRADKYGQTPLYIACEKGRADAARLLLGNGAKVDMAEKDGRTLLDIAKSQGHSSIVALLEEGWN